LAHSFPWNQRFEMEELTVRHEWQGVPPGIQRIRDVEFRRVAGRPLRLDIFIPEGVDAPAPVVVWICGGGWRNMDRHGAERVSAWLAGRGCAVAGIDYRVEREAKFPAQIEDCKAAVRWLRAHAEEQGLDPDRVAIWGDSAGGHLAELVGVSAGVKALERQGPHLDVSSGVAAVCAFYPPSDMRSYAAGEHAGLFDGPQGSDQRKRWVSLASPIDHVGPAAPPHLLVHGDADDIVPLEHSTRFQQALRAAGVECTLAVLPGVGHDGHTLYGAEEVQQLVAAFFARHLKGT
jgi:acetyl esterase/lipase